VLIFLFLPGTSSGSLDGPWTGSGDGLQKNGLISKMSLKKCHFMATKTTIWHQETNLHKNKYNQIAEGKMPLIYITRFKFYFHMFC
jgi:hypothetical protein